MKNYYSRLKIIYHVLSMKKIGEDKVELRDLFELENDRIFQGLAQKLSSFNTLKVLRLENHEIRHSNILSWLLSPKENHHIHDLFLRKMIEHLILQDKNTANVQYEKVSEILNDSLVDSYVYREVKTDENRFIDLVIVNHQLHVVIVIENKLYATESEHQLDDYLEYIQDTFENYTIVPVYLTIDGESPSNENYFVLAYEQIEVILSSILERNNNQMNHQVYGFISDYKEVLNEKFHPMPEQILQAISLYRNYESIIIKLFEATSISHKQLHYDHGYRFGFITKYEETINYIFKHGQNILSYSFEEFIKQQFNDELLLQAHPTTPNMLLPPEWNMIGNVQLRQEQYWLGKGLIVWFERSTDGRLRIVVELGPIECRQRLRFLEHLEKLGILLHKHSKLETARFTRFYSNKIDINEWTNVDELTNAMIELYNAKPFVRLKEQVATVLNDQYPVKEELADAVNKQLEHEKENINVQTAFKRWMESIHLSEDDYRISSRKLSFKTPLFDTFKEELGETREPWWWDNGPFLFWMNIDQDSIYFTLEVGPIEADKRVILMEAIKEQRVTFNKKGLTLEAKYNRIHSETISIKGLNGSEILRVFETLYNNENLQRILSKLIKIHDEITFEDSNQFE